MLEHLAAPVEIKFAEAEGAGSFEGLASAWGVVDSHGDVCAPGCFALSLAEHKARGTMPIMYGIHGPALPGGDPYPIGVWTHMEETAEGLYAKGQILNMDTERGKNLRGLMAGGALKALSIGFQVPPGGSSYNSKAKPGEARRTLKNVRLIEVSPVPIGSNPRARVQHVRSELLDDIAEFKARIASGERVEVREYERLARDVFGFSRMQAEVIANHGFKALYTRESGSGEANKAAVQAAQEMRAALDGFSLPRF
jgi:HK97 family phage prohead protease